eukprot:CAMPEP_0115641158 /NCGR_PEP_ID=MMETSP0272-20121206/36167_1 /TAXON_ID=71861 /ORGANISM="Scrippsiella trochoidea, Strain CCMP3099" /LENGTH=47 /DNA_ID= /DNA_START= /DNA_END= /DNA_ORIENTATION=
MKQLPFPMHASPHASGKYAAQAGVVELPPTQPSPQQSTALLKKPPVE